MSSRQGNGTSPCLRLHVIFEVSKDALVRPSSGVDVGVGTYRRDGRDRGREPGKIHSGLSEELFSERILKGSVRNEDFLDGFQGILSLNSV